jgi:hypothetical protein
MMHGSMNIKPVTQLIVSLISQILKDIQKAVQRSIYKKYKYILKLFCTEIKSVTATAETNIVICMALYW